jgi:hypothetical protein
MSLGRYSAEIKAIAIDVGRYLRDAGIVEVAHQLADELGPEGIFEMTPEEQEKALKFLSQTPSQQVKALGRLYNEEAALLIIRAKYFGLISARAMSLADHFEFVPGKGYRDAAQYGARLYLQSRIVPTLQELLPRWTPKPDIAAEASGPSPKM